MKIFNFLVLAFLISGCAANVQTSSTQQGPKESTGALSGMIIGGALANDMAGESKNKALATVLGAFVGGVIGQNIGAQLDERDRLLAGQAYNTALEFIHSIRCKNPFRNTSSHNIIKSSTTNIYYPVSIGH